MSACFGFRLCLNLRIKIAGLRVNLIAFNSWIGGRWCKVNLPRIGGRWCKVNLPLIPERERKSEQVFKLHFWQMKETNLWQKRMVKEAG